MAEDLIGRTLLDGEYRLTGVLGRGGMATVYRAYSRSLETDVAVKVLAPRLASDPGFRERHHDEARSLAQLHHPNLIEVHHYGEEGDLVYIVMRLVPGGTLKSRLEALGSPLGLIPTARLIGQVADALQLAHDRGLVHLDIKPANILLGRSDWPLLADFGITRAVQSLQSSKGNARMAGTPSYMSPEQCQGENVDGRSDQYSLAITTYELLTGRRPFQAETTEALLQRQIEEPPLRPREINPGIPGPVENVLLRALAKAPEDRYPTIRDFASALVEASERTRGVSLETKEAVARVTPNIVGVLALILFGPLLFGLLPGGASLGPSVPLSWPFQLILSVFVALLMLGIRWQVIGLVSRGVGLLLDAAQTLGGWASVSPSRASEPLDVKRLRNAVVGSVEGTVNLVYLFVIYRLIAVPLLAILGAVVDTSVETWITTGTTVVVVVVALGMVASIYRSGGAVVAGITMGVCWAFASALPSSDVSGSASLSWTLRAVVAAGIVVVLLATRRSAQPFVRRLALASLGPVVIEARAGSSPDEVAAARDHLTRVVGGAVDFLYLLVGYALLRTPLIQVLQPLTGLTAAAILVSGLAFVFWLLLISRLRLTAGGSGLALGVLLGAPLLVSLPLFQPSVLGLSWPATVATWVVGSLLVLVLASVRGEVQQVGRKALGPALDRGLLGTQTARTEEHSDRRASALGAVGGAGLDVAYLVLAYWILGGPVATVAGKTTGRAGVGSLLLVALVLGSIALLLGPVHHALATVEETGGPRWFARFRALPALMVALVALLVGGCAAVPMAFAAPDVAGGMVLAANAGSTVVVDWEHWLPWTPTRQDATFEISLSCSDGRTFGQFREVFRPATGAPMPSGNVGALGPTNDSCDNWTSAYFARRRTAGIPSRPSASLDWLAVQVTILPDGSANVVETHREIFTAGAYDHLTWTLDSSPEKGQVTNLQVIEDGQSIPLNPARPGSQYARASSQNGQLTVDWWFPTVESPAEHVYTLSYRLTDAVKSSGTGVRFDRQVLPASRLGPAWRTTVEVSLPLTFPTQDVRLGANWSPARFGFVAGRQASYAAENVPDGSNLDVFIDFPRLSGSPGPSPSPTATASPTPNPTATASATLSALADTSVNLPTATPLAEATWTPTIGPTSSPTPTVTASPTATPTATVSATATSTASALATTAATATSSATSVASTGGACGNVSVLAMYYDWYDMNTWTSGKTSDQPVTPYVSADRSTIERQVSQAQGVGIDGFEVNWWGPGNQTDTNLQTLLSVAAARGFKVTVDFDLNSPFVKSASDITNDLKYLQRYYGNSAWFHCGGKPYVVFYGTRKYDVATWKGILTAADPGHQVLWIAEGDIFSELDAFDGIHPYSVAWSPDPSSQLASYARQARAYAGKIWMATVMPGYNDKLVNGAQGFAVDRQNGAYYTRMWQGAVATRPDVLSITSFNEWVEGSQIEPSKSYGNLFLDLTRQMTTKYRSQLESGG